MVPFLNPQLPRTDRVLDVGTVARVTGYDKVLQASSPALRGTRLRLLQEGDLDEEALLVAIELWWLDSKTLPALATLIQDSSLASWKLGHTLMRQNHPLAGALQDWPAVACSHALAKKYLVGKPSKTTTLVTERSYRRMFKKGALAGGAALAGTFTGTPKELADTAMDLKSTLLEVQN